MYIYINIHMCVCDVCTCVDLKLCHILSIFINNSFPTSFRPMSKTWWSMVDVLHTSSQGQRTKHCRVHNGHLWRIAAKFTFPTLCVCVWNSVVKYQSLNRSETTRRGVNVFVGHERPQWHFVSGPTQSSRHRWTTGTSELSALAPVASCAHGACTWPSLECH